MFTSKTRKLISSMESNRANFVQIEGKFNIIHNQ